MIRRRTVAISGLSVAGTLAPGLPVIRALRSAPEFAARWRIVGLSYDPLDPPNYDPALLDKTYLLPYPSFGVERLFDRLSYIHRQERLDAVMPTLDSELPLYIQLAPRLRLLGIQLLLPSEDAFNLRSKSELPKVAKLTGLRVPESLVARSLDEAITQAQKLSLPLVVKGNLHGATVVHSLDQVAPAAITHASRWGYPVVLQEFIPGTEFDVVALADKSSELVGAVPMKKLQLDDRGKAWGALTIDDPALCRQAEQAVRGLRWHGALELELVRHRDSGEHYLIEINPRFPAWVHLAVAAGQNLPWAMLQLTMGEPVARFPGYQVGVLQLRRAVDETASLAAYESLVSRGEASPEKPEPGSIQPRFTHLPAPSAAPPAKPDAPKPAPPAKDAEPVRNPDALSPAPHEWGSVQGENQTEVYQRPSIVRHHSGIGSRFTNGRGHRVLSELDGIPVADLVKQHGSPLFVFSERTLRARCASLRQVFTSRYPKVRFAWSYKTNYIDALCGILHQEGWEAEVVSDLEYAMARRLGISGPRIICNGAYKPLAWLEQAAEEGALIQLDHFDELDQLEAVARRRKLKLPVGLRVNLRTEALGGASWERFGFNLDNGEVLDAILRIQASDSLRLVGLHCHLGTFINEPKAYQQAAASLLELFGAAEQLCGYRLSILNIGGGFPSSNTLVNGYGEGDSQSPDMVPFAEAVINEIRSVRGKNPADLPTLVLESGRHLIDDAGSLIATVVGTRRLASGERGVVLDGGLNVLYTAHWYRHRVTPAQPVPGPIEETTLHGPLCMNIDVLRAGLALPLLGPGHRVVIQPAGAYNVTQWMQFSQRRPAIVLIGQNGQVDVIRRAESIDDVKGPELLPARYAAVPPIK